MDQLSTQFTYQDLLNSRTGKALVEYKYHGRDDSILYEHVISPGCDYLTNHVIPSWLAPNTITVAGFLFNLVPHLYVMIGDYFGVEHGPCIYFVHGVCILLYVVIYL